ncbi:MAG: Uma2 family endonuclease [Firmicutes bacterium]|nr:Uma2 family endonuclease [Bacillota bacterium]
MGSTVLGNRIFTSIKYISHFNYFNYFEMSVSRRHDDILTDLLGELYVAGYKKSSHFSKEGRDLVYNDNFADNTAKLIDISKLTDINYFKNKSISSLEYVVPDFILFKENEYIENKKGTRTAGRPDLVVEVWSDGNDDIDILNKQNLYASSPVTEFWQIEQDSNIVKRSIGKTQLKSLSLTEDLYTESGITVNISHLALQN